MILYMYLSRKFGYSLEQVVPTMMAFNCMGTRSSEGNPPYPIIHLCTINAVLKYGQMMRNMWLHVAYSIIFISSPTAFCQAGDLGVVRAVRMWRRMGPRKDPKPMGDQAALEEVYAPGLLQVSQLLSCFLFNLMTQKLQFKFMK